MHRCAVKVSNVNGGIYARIKRIKLLYIYWECNGFLANDQNNFPFNPHQTNFLVLIIVITKPGLLRANIFKY